MPGKLLLLPNVLEETLSTEPFLPISVQQAVQTLDGVIAESDKAARRYLRKFLSHEDMAKMPLKSLNEHTKDIKSLLTPILEGQTWGILSDAGLACIADPGSDLVYLAHQNQIAVETFVGPCSIIMALQLSGFNGQKFSFHGYLPKEEKELIDKIKKLEKSEGAQIWIEAPYRSEKMLEILKKNLHDKTKLCVAVNLTTSNQIVISQEIREWKKNSLVLKKEPAVFLLDAN